MVKQEAGITIADLGGNKYVATVTEPGVSVYDITLEFSRKTNRIKVLDTTEEIIACGDSIEADPDNLSLFANHQVVNTIVPIRIDSDVCINGIAGLGKPNPLLQTTEPAHINWALICGAPTAIILSGLVGAHLVMKRLQLGHISKPEPAPAPPGPMPIYTTPAERAQTRDFLLDSGIDPDLLSMSDDGTVVYKNPLLGDIPMAKASNDILRFADADQKLALREYYANLGVKIYDGYLPDGVTGALLVYETDKDGKDIGTPVAIYDPELSRFLPPSNHQQP